VFELELVAAWRSTDQLRVAVHSALNLDYDEWYAFLSQKDMVAALLDRLRHRCHTIRIDGPSLRTPLE